MSNNSIFKTLLAAVVIAVMTVTAAAFFDPDGPYYGKVIITRANTYETCPTNINVFTTNSSMIGVEFYDHGYTNSAITYKYGGNPTNTFYCSWPVTFYVWIQTNSAVLIGGEYEIARLQYFEGTNTALATNWIDISVITNFDYSLGSQGAHMGMETWYPPKTNDTFYLIRLWARLKDGSQSAALSSTNITCKGNNVDWHDYEVLLIKTCPLKKPGL